LAGSGGVVATHGSEILRSLLGSKAATLEGLISQYAGIKPISAASLLGIAGTLGLGVLGKKASDDHLDTRALANYLSSQQPVVTQALPASFGSVSSIFGSGAAGNEHTVSHHVEHAVEESNGSSKFLVPLWLGILATALSIFIFKGCGAGGRQEMMAEADTVGTHKMEVMADPSMVHEVVKVKLPNDTVIEAYKGGIEDKLVAFLKTDYKKLKEDSLKKTWFDFDNLNFETGSARITPESQVQVDNITAILKAFPKAALKIGGYTDRVGDSAVNAKLSDERAKSVRAALEKQGVGKQIIGAEGYGSKFAMYPADAPEADRLKDRHVSVSPR
jgi:outer membrane protein OmpA-like peptidoglycan-associated protein